MNLIGIIAPKSKRITPFKLYKFWNYQKPDYLFNEKHMICFVIAYDNQRVNRIFRKNNVFTAVNACSSAYKKRVDALICDGTVFYKRFLRHFISKAFKNNKMCSDSASIAIVCDKPDYDVYELIQFVSQSFRYITLASMQEEEAQKLTERAANELGVIITLQNQNEPICSDLIAEVTPADFSYAENAVVVSIQSNVLPPPEYAASLPKGAGLTVRPVELYEALYFEKTRD